MAPRPDTVTGTITLTSGSTAFTSSGVNFITRNHLPGDTILRADGSYLVIETITGENAGTLRDACPATSAGTQPARVRFQADGSRVAAQTRNLIDLLGNGTLQSIADTTLVAKNILRATGPNTLGQIPFTDAMAQLADDPDFATMRQTLELLPVQTSLTDNSPNRLLRTGAFGLGGLVVMSGGFDDFRPAGRYYSFDAPNGPYVGFFGYYDEYNNDSPDYRYQRAVSSVSYSVVERWKIDGIWYPWSSARPERGSNANGHFVRFSDGTQICWKQRSFTSDITIPVGSLYFSAANISMGAYPAAFSEAPAVTVAPYASDGGILVSVYVGTHTMAPDIRMVRGATQSARSDSVWLQAIGRWK